MPARNEHMAQQGGGGIVACVCSGFARRWGLDVGVLRFAFVALTIVSFGAFALVYVALWLVLPSQSIDQHTVDVKPDFATSEMYGTCEKGTACHKKTKERIDYSHVPPQNPEQAANAHLEAMRARAASQSETTSGVPVFVALILGTTLVVIGMSFIISMMIPIFSPLQFWPLVLVGFGIMRMVVPPNEGYRMGSFALGVAMLCVGAVLVLGTTGIFIIHYAEWFQQAWPLLAMSFGVMLLWRATCSNGFALLALALLAAFCIVGFMYCAEPGPAITVVTNQPFAKDLPVMGVYMP